MVYTHKDMIEELNYEEYEGEVGYTAYAEEYNGSQMEIIPMSRWFSSPAVYKNTYTWSYDSNPFARRDSSTSSCDSGFGVRRASISCVASYMPLSQEETLSPIMSCSSFSTIRLSIGSMSGRSTRRSSAVLCQHSSYSELMRINHVLWYAWFIRGISLAGSSEGIGAEGSGSSNQCTRCGAGFSFLFNRRATCAACQLNVCRKCATWEAQAKNYLCNVCLQPPQDQPKHPPPPPAAEVEAGVRGHIESLVEGRLGGPIDQVNITGPSTQHPNWGGLFKTHHAALTQAVANLSYALQMSILNREVPPSSSPSVRHTQLSEALGRVIQESTMILPNNGGKPGYDPVASPEMPVEDYNSQTYEDILATAILNKVLEKCEGNHISGGEVTIELTQDSASTDTDSGCSGGHTENRSRGAQEERNSISEVSEDSFTTSPRKKAQNEEDTASSTILSRTGAASPDQGVASDDAWPEKAPLTFKIEEHFEEITTERLTEDEHSSNEAPEYGGDKYGGDTSDSCGSLRGSRTSLDSRNGRTRHSPGHHSRSTRSHTRYHREEADDHTSLLPALNFTLPDNINEAIRRVSFPELGADIVGESCLAESEEEVYPGDLVVDGDASWEENWLFQKNRLVGNRETQHDPVTMLIPNPNDSVVTTVGNSIQVM